MGIPLGEDLSPLFQRTESLFREAITSVSDPDGYFASAEYAGLKHHAAAVFTKLEVPLQVFFDVIRGHADGSHWGHPNLGAALSFPKRFLRGTPWKLVPAPIQETLDNLIHQNFFLGLASHFFLNTFPTRSELERVDLAALLREWSVSSLVADVLMREYSHGANDLPKRIFEWYFERNAKPTLRETVGLGFWRMAKARSFFRNLYFAGAQLGMQFDLATRATTS